MPSLQSALNDFYNALLGDSVEEVEDKFKVTKNVLVNIYKNSDGTITDHNAMKFGILQTVLALVGVSANFRERAWSTAFGIQVIERLGKHFVGNKAKVIAFLKKVNRNIEKSNCFQNIRLEGAKIVNKRAVSSSVENSNLRLLIASVNRSAESLGQELNLPPVDIELTDAELRQLSGRGD